MSRPIGEVCAEIKTDIEADVHRMEGAEFTGKTVAEWMGNLSAAASALAGMVSKLDARLASVETLRAATTHDGDVLVYDGIGKRELDRLRSLLTHPDRYTVTTWEVVEIADDELERARGGSAARLSDSATS